MNDPEEQVEALVIGGGSAGLAVSHELERRGVDHLVLERGRIGQSWRDRWDSFCLVTPNWSVQLPDGAYDESDPDGFMPRDEIVAFLERYASLSGTPVREGVSVRSLQASSAGGFAVETSGGAMHARHVVIATGAYQRPHRPAGAGSPGGYRPDYRSWLPWPSALDDLGFPIQAEGASTVVDDLYFIGVPFLRNRKSSLLIGVGDDATVIADTIAARAAVT